MVTNFSPLKSIFFVALTVFLSFYGISQTGAAGVGSSATNVVWLDAHDMNLPDGASVGTFSDVSGNGNDFTQATGSKRPSNVDGIVNGLPALYWDNTDDKLESGSIPAIESANVTYFIVFAREPMDNAFLIGSNYSSSDKKWQSYSTTASTKIINSHYSPTIQHASYLEPTSDFTFLSNHITPTNMKIYSEGSLVATKVAAYTTPTGHSHITLGNVQKFSSNNYTLDGYIAEVVIYNTALTNLERVLVENYIGNKYGMTIPSDFYAYEGTHNIGIIGIGNDGADSHSNSQGNGIVEFDSPTDMGANEYLLAGHTDNLLSEFNTDVPTAGNERFVRTWRVDETGDVGTVTVTFHLSGAEDFAAAATYRMLVDTDAAMSDATEIAGVYSAGTVTFTHDFADGEFFTLSGNPASSDIISVDSGPWSEPATWDCTCIPSIIDNVTIDSDHDVELDGDFSVKNLTINPDGILTSAAGNTLSITQDFTINGLLNLTTGSIEFLGSSAQTVDGGGQVGPLAFNGLDFNGSGTVTFQNVGSYELNGKLSPNSGGMTVSSPFIINSTSPTTEGYVGQIGAGFSFSGNFTVRRFIQSGNADWRDLASPVNGATFADWDDDILISGEGFPDGCAYSAEGCFYSVRYWKQDNSYNVTSLASSIENGKGYEVFVGDDLDTWAGGTIDVTGTLNDDGDINVSHTTGGWMTVGNPYASPVTYSTTDRTSQVSDYYYVWDAGSGSYQWWDGTGVPTGSIAEIGSEGTMAIGQGIWIYLTSAGTLTWGQADKTDNVATYIRGAESFGEQMLFTVTENSSTYSTNFALQQTVNATDQWDSLIDIRHLPMSEMNAEFKPKAPAFLIRTNEELVRKNHISKDHFDKSFDIFSEILNDGEYTLSAQNVESFSNYSKVLLIDKLTGESVNLKNENYTFYSEAGEYDRFKIVLTNSDDSAEGTIAEDEDGNITLTQMGHLIDVTARIEEESNAFVSVTNLLGQKVVYENQTQLVNGSNIISLPDNLSGVHIVTITYDNKVVSKKIML